MRNINPPNTGPGYDGPINLCDLPIGTRFMEYIDGQVWSIPDEIHTGTLLWVSPGSVEVALDRGRYTTRWQPEVPVYILDEQDLWPEQADVALAAISPDTLTRLIQEMQDTVAATTNTKATEQVLKTLIVRWNFQMQTLVSALEGDEKAKASATRSRIEKLAVEAAGLHVLASLPSPPAEIAGDPVFEIVAKLICDDGGSGTGGQGDVDQGDTGDVAMGEEQPSSNENLQTASPVAAAKARAAARDAARDKHRQAQVQAKVASGQVKPKATGGSKTKELKPCLDGCGGLTGGNFVMGHDAKLKSLLMKIERGDADITQVPDIIQDIVKFRVGEKIVERDGSGNVKREYQTYELIACPVKVPGRPEIQLTTRADIDK